MKISRNFLCAIVVFFCISEANANTVPRTPHQANRLTVYEYFTNLYPTDPVTTEYSAYTLLKSGALSFDDDQNYVAIPWAVLINRKQLDKAASLPIKVDHGFTICQHILYEQMLPIAKKMGIDTVFTPHVCKEYEGIRVLPFPHYPINGADPNSEKNIWFSFIGVSFTHSVRNKIFQLDGRSENIVLKKRNHWLAMGASDRKEYRDVLARSRYSLCPRGTGASTIRFWESLQAGAIPVLLSDAMQLPEGFDWDNCIVRVKEEDVLKIPDILKAISSEQEGRMRQNCLDVYQAICAGKNFVQTIRSYYSENR